MKRGHIKLTTKLAATICVLLEIPHEHSKLMTEDQVLSLVQWDHYPIRKEYDGPDVHWNLVARPILEHRRKTKKIDLPASRKAKRIRRKLAAIASKSSIPFNVSEKKQWKRRWPSRKLPSRKFSSTPSGW